MKLPLDENGFVWGYAPDDNWIRLVEECEDIINCRFRDENTNEEYRFFGLVHSYDDYYYGMYGKSGLRLLSCVGNLETHGFRRISNEPEPEPKLRFDGKLQRTR